MSKIIDIPNYKLDEIILEKLSQSEKVTIVVSFFFVSGLKLILNGLNSFEDKSKITILTSNYLKSTQPEALEILLKLKIMELKSIYTTPYLQEKVFILNLMDLNYLNQIILSLLALVICLLLL